MSADSYRTPEFKKFYPLFLDNGRSRLKVTLKDGRIFEGFFIASDLINIERPATVRFKGDQLTGPTKMEIEYSEINSVEQLLGAAC